MSDAPSSPTTPAGGTPAVGGPPPVEDHAIRWDEPVTDREARALAGPRRRRRWPAVLGSFVLLVVVGLGAAGFWVSRQIDPPGEPGAEVEVIVEPGSSSADVGRLLADLGVISDARIFDAYLRVTGEGGWQAGRYVLARNSSFDEAIAVLDAGPGELPFDQVTVPEGYSVFASAGLPAPGNLVTRLVDEEAGIPRLDQQRIMALLLDGGLRSQFQPPEVNNLEGFLFPDTYRLEEDEGERALLRLMIERFDEIATEVGLGDATNRVSQATGGAVTLSPYEVLIVASLIEREARVPEERPQMARVIYNRLADGTPLGIDASLNYGIGRPATTQSDLDIDSPFNLREVGGLPPSPIAVPGRASLEAALAPAQGEWRYYVLTDESGRHTFTVTYDEFLEAKAICQQRGLC